MLIDQEILTVLSGLTVADNRVTIAAQLDRKLYVKVNEVLEACGLKWSRKAKAHLCEGGDADAILDRVITTGEVTTDADLGFFQTPVALARRLVDLAEVDESHWVLEPSAGGGRIVDQLLDSGAVVVAVERDEGRRRALQDKSNRHLEHPSLGVSSIDDFMNFMPEPFDRVVMNPPFRKCGKGDHLDHVRHAFEMLCEGGILVSVLPASVIFRQDRRHAEFRRWAEARGTIEPLEADAFKASGTGVRTCVARLVA